MYSEKGAWNLYNAAGYGVTTPFHGTSNLGRHGWLDEWGQAQDRGAAGASLAHSNEKIAHNTRKDSSDPMMLAAHKKAYSANAGAPAGQMGGAGFDAEAIDAASRGFSGSSSLSAGNSDTNLYCYAGNDPVNGFDAMGLETDPKPRDQLLFPREESGASATNAASVSKAVEADQAKKAKEEVILTVNGYIDKNTIDDVKGAKNLLRSQVKAMNKFLIDSGYSHVKVKIGSILSGKKFTANSKGELGSDSSGSDHSKKYTEKLKELAAGADMGVLITDLQLGPLNNRGTQLFRGAIALRFNTPDGSVLPDLALAHEFGHVMGYRGPSGWFHNYDDPTSLMFEDKGNDGNFTDIGDQMDFGYRRSLDNYLRGYRHEGL